MANAILDEMLGASATLNVIPDPVYVGLSKTTIGDDGSNITEPTGGSYAKVSKPNDGASFSAAVSREKRNADQIDFPQASGDWGEITDWFLSDAAGTTIYAHGKLDDGVGGNQPREVFNGDDFRILVNQMRVRLL